MTARLALVAAVVATAGCSVTSSRPQVPPNLVCVAGHDVKDSGGDHAVFLCDTYSPAPDRASRSVEREPLPPSNPPFHGQDASRSAPIRGARSAASSGLHNWAAVAACESGGDWHINTANGYYGGVQESLTFWRDYGGLRFAARPDLASEAQQITVAERGLAVQGHWAWPVCGRWL